MASYLYFLLPYLNPSPRDMGNVGYTEIHVKGVYPASSEGVFYVGVGATVCVLLGLLRLRFLWWPFHPVGYILSNSLPLAHGLFPFFIAWVAKTLVTRYGGLRLYRSTLPLAIGLILGDLLNTTVWNIVALVTKGQI